MNTILKGSLAALSVATAFAVTASAGAQTPDAKEKPPMYTYVANWTIPRAKWAEMEKGNAATNKDLERDFQSGTLVGYGNDVVLVHTEDGATHDGWWSGMSMAAVLNVLEGFYKSGSVATPALNSATKHWDGIYVSRFYNWRPGSYKGAYTRTALYKLKADAPNDAVTTLCKSLVVPLLEKALADGAVIEYEVDEETIHTQSPGSFWIVFITPNAEGLDKVNAALREALAANPLAGPAFGSMTDSAPHRDYLSRSDATYK